MQTLTSYLSHLRYACRVVFLRKQFAIAAISSLAIAIAGMVAVFSAVNAVLLEPLPFHSPERIVTASEFTPTINNHLVAPLTYYEWRGRTDIFSHLAAFNWWESSRLEVNGVHTPILHIRATPSYFQVMGIQPILGQPLSLQKNAGTNEAVLSYEVWRDRFGSDRSILGKALRLNGSGFVVVGVMPPAYTDSMIGWGEVWTPLRLNEQAERVRPQRFIRVIGRLASTISLGQAEERLRVMERILQRTYPALGTEYDVSVKSIGATTAGAVGPALMMLFGAVCFLFLAACANVANLYLARVTERDREFAVRAAVGASLKSLFGLLLTEGLILSVCGALIGVFLAWVGIHLVQIAQPPLPRLQTIRIAWPVLLFFAGLTAATSMVISVSPFLWLRKIRIIEHLKEGGRSGSAGRRQQFTRTALVIAQVAFSVLLMIGAGLLARSLSALTQVHPGFEPAQAMMFDLTLSGDRYEKRDQVATFYRRLIDQFQSVPGITSIGGVRYFPYSSRLWTTPVFVQGNPAAAGQEPIVHWNLVTGNYFKSMGIPLLGGRLYTEREMWDSGDTVVINDTMARTVFAGEDPLGKRIREVVNGPDLTVIGVVGDVRQMGLETPAKPEMYLPFAGLKDELSGIATFVVRTTATTIPAPVFRNQLRNIDPGLLTVNLQPLEDYVQSTMAVKRFLWTVVIVFALVALLLTAAGIYGTLSYVVTVRRNEVGIRSALGATQVSILGMFLAYGIKIGALGIFVGVIASTVAMRFLSTLVYGVSVYDLVTYAVVVVVVTGVTSAASLIPAWRAARMDPTIALR